jgi:hypothetical protein
MLSNFLRSALFFIAACALSTWASAQNAPKTACSPDQAVKAEQLYGRWDVRFAKTPAGLPARATMVLERHAEFTESLAGTVSRELDKTRDRAGNKVGTQTPGGHAAKAELAGDLEDGMLLLDESSDNISITGTWNGEMVEGSCGKVFQGTWKDTSPSAPNDAPDVPFTLTKLP